MIDHAHSLVDRWLSTYPNVRPWVDDKAREALRHSEDDWLDSFKGADILTREQVHDLIDWKWAANPARRSKSRRGVDAGWEHASDCITRALAYAGADDIATVNALRGRSDGIPDWETAMASVVLAACRPALYTVVDSRALHTMMLLEGRSSTEIQRIRWFPPGCWLGYLHTCRELSAELRVRLRDLDRAFWTSDGREEPPLDSENPCGLSCRST
jgi:hypothetical protein